MHCGNSVGLPVESELEQKNVYLFMVGMVCYFTGETVCIVVLKQDIHFYALNAFSLHIYFVTITLVVGRICVVM
jgi:hypothetical protein